MNECIFCRIASGEDRAEIMYEDNRVLELMDICPIRPGMRRSSLASTSRISKTFLTRSHSHRAPSRVGFNHARPKDAASQTVRHIVEPATSHRKPLRARRE